MKRLVLLAAAAMSLGGTGAQAQEKLKIGMTFQELNNPYFVSMQEALKEAAASIGATPMRRALTTAPAWLIAFIANWLSCRVMAWTMVQFEPSGTGISGTCIHSVAIGTVVVVVGGGGAVVVVVAPEPLALDPELDVLVELLPEPLELAVFEPLLVPEPDPDELVALPEPAAVWPPAELPVPVVPAAAACAAAVASVPLIPMVVELKVLPVWAAAPMEYETPRTPRPTTVTALRVEFLTRQTPLREFGARGCLPCADSSLRSWSRRRGHRRKRLIPKPTVPFGSPGRDPEDPMGPRVTTSWRDRAFLLAP